MPIAYNCPHCGKGFTVADQYAGQTGPCAACGQTITIPMAGPAAFAPPAKGGGTSVATIVMAVVIVLLLCTGLPIALLLPAVQSARAAARRMQSSNNLKQIALALHNYHDVYGSLPPAVVTDANGTPLYSGRVLLLPYLEQAALYNSFDLTQSWDSPRNMPISQTMISTFRDPANTSALPGSTDYLFVTGTNTAFEVGKKVRFADITDGTSNTLAVVEVKGSGVHWAEPKDLDLSQPASLPPGNHTKVNLAAMLDGSVRTLSNNMGPQQVHSIATRNGGEPVGGL